MRKHLVRKQIPAFVLALFLATPSVWAQEPSDAEPANNAPPAIAARERPNPLPKEADKLHVVLLVFGHKGGISNACLKDCKAVKSVLEAAFAEGNDENGEEQAQQRLVIHDLSVKNPKTGKVYTMNETMDVIKGLQVGPNDNVLIFQSGHGEIRDQFSPELSHLLQMDGCSLTRAQIQQPILAMKPRALLFLTDCCSAIVGGRKLKNPASEQVSLNTPNKESIRNLMLRPAGIVSITAAEDGKLAVATFNGPNPAKAGSAFTVALLRLWHNDTVYTNWWEFFPILKAETGAASRNQHLARAFRINDGVLPTDPLIVMPRLVLPAW